MAQSKNLKAMSAAATGGLRAGAGEARQQALRAQIDENLRRVYEEALVQEIPDRFAELLSQLRQKETGP